MLYLAHMLHIGRYHEPLVAELFEARDCGPVLPSVRDRTSLFGAKPVRNVFHGAGEIGSERVAQTLKEAIGSLEGKTPAELVAITHWRRGAWARHYKGGRRVRIPHRAVREEYDQRVMGA
jgi:uncharacterized phage-associated protein